MVRSRPGASSAEKFSDQLCHVSCLLEMRHMPHAVQHRDARAGDMPGEFIGIGRRDDGPAAAYSFGGEESISQANSCTLRCFTLS